MTINNIDIKDGNIVITVDSSAGVSKVYIDSIYNEANRFSTDDDKHTYVVTDATIATTSILIALDGLSPELDTSAFTVTINGVLGFYFDSEELYYKEIELLTEYCSTCLDKHQKERMVLFVLKQQLLQYAVDNNLVEDQIGYYRDLARMLRIDVEQGFQGLCPGNCKKGRCISCCNGVCRLC